MTPDCEPLTDYVLPKGKALALRTCNPDMTSHGGFKWPKSGPVVCADWSDESVCGKGLHGLLWGEGDGSLLGESNCPHLVVEIDEASKVDLKCQVKFPSCTVVHCGDAKSATDFMRAVSTVARSMVRATLTGGDRATLTGGYGATLTGGDRATLTGGDGATLTGGDGATLTGGYGATLTGGAGATLTGGYGATLTGGDGATLTGGDGATLTGGVRATLTGGAGATLTGGYGATLTGGYGATLTGGDRATLTGGDRATLTGGDRATLTGGDRATLTGGYGATCKTGSVGIIAVKWWDAKAERSRLTVGYVGEDGIKPDTFYRCDNAGKIVESK